MVAASTSWLCPHCGHSMPKSAVAATAAAVPVAAAAVINPIVQPVPAPLPVPTPTTTTTPTPAPTPPVASVPVVSPVPMGGQGGIGIGRRGWLHLPGWLLAIIAVPVLAGGLLLAVMASNTVNHERNLLKTGKVGQAVVVSSQVQISQNNNNDSSSNTVSNRPNVSTEVTYKLVGVPGYADQTYTSTFGGNQSPTIQAGQQLPVVYNPSNPADNGLQQALQDNTSPLAVIVPWLFLIIPVIVIVSVILASRRAKQRKLAIQDLQS